MPVKVLYATTTGTAARLAERLRRTVFALNVSGYHMDVTAVNLAECDPEALERDKAVPHIILLPTWTDGAPPPTAAGFYEHVRDLATDFRVSKDTLEGLRYAVFGLGSSEYGANWCRAALQVHEDLATLSGEPLADLGRGDDAQDMESQFAVWLDRVVPHLCELHGEWAAAHGATAAAPGAGGCSTCGNTSTGGRVGGGGDRLEAAADAYAELASPSAAAGSCCGGSGGAECACGSGGGEVAGGAALDSEVPDGKGTRRRWGGTQYPAAAAAAPMMPRKEWRRHKAALAEEERRAKALAARKERDAAAAAAAAAASSTAAAPLVHTSAGPAVPATEGVADAEPLDDGGEVDETEEDRVNAALLAEADLVAPYVESDDEGGGGGGGGAAGEPLADIEDMGDAMGESKGEGKGDGAASDGKAGDRRAGARVVRRRAADGSAASPPAATGPTVAAPELPDMVTPAQRRALVKEGYQIIGSHSAVKLCRWTKAQLRGRGGCYKHTAYGITSFQCMEATPSLACGESLGRNSSHHGCTRAPCLTPPPPRTLHPRCSKQVHVLLAAPPQPRW
jgi:flavodoxin